MKISITHLKAQNRSTGRQDIHQTYSQTIIMEILHLFDIEVKLDNSKYLKPRTEKGVT